MNVVPKTRENDASERASLHSRIKRFYQRFNDGDWEACHAFIDPQLTERGKVELSTYADRMGYFKSIYGRVHPWTTRLSLHLEGAPKQGDKRPFAYVYLVWQDDAHGFHMFRERWVKVNCRWYTRVVGLVPNEQNIAATRD